jgi:hypothetical protein
VSESITPVLLSAIPYVLRERDDWVNYKLPSKQPVPAIGRSTLSFAVACDRDPHHVGFVFHAQNPYAGIDIDADTSLELKELLLRRAEELGAYRETSIGGRGMHIIGHGALVRGISKASTPQKVEAYSTGRYFTVTGRGEGSPEVSIQPLLDHLEGLRSERATPGSKGSATTTKWADSYVDALDYIDPDCNYATWLEVGMGLRAAGAPFSVWDEWSAQSSAKYPGTENCRAKWGSFKREGITLASVLHHAREGGWGTAKASDFPLVDEAEVEETTNPWRAHSVLASSLVGEPPHREWAWDQWLPLGVVTGLAGPPGVAKSTLALQLCVHCATGTAYLGDQMAPGPAVFLTVEDDIAELHRRYHRICDALFLLPHEVEDLHLVSATDLHTQLVTVNRDGVTLRTKRMTALRDWLAEVKPRIVVLDLVGDFWGGNENSRAEVSDYVRFHLGRLAAQINTSIIAISHPSVASMADGRGFSGSTAWVGSFRSAITMLPAPDGRGSIVLSRIKANYATLDEAELRWHQGYIMELSRETRDAEERARLLTYLDRTPWDEWHGIRALAQHWHARERIVRPIVAEMVERGWLEARRHGGAAQWRRTEVFAERGGERG